MRNYVQPGNIIEVEGPTDMEAGKGYVIGSLFGIAAANSKAWEKNSLHVKGVYRIPTNDPVAVPGDKAYFVDSLKEIYNAPPYSTDTYMIGVIVGRTATEMEVLLAGVPVTPAASA